MGKGEIEIATLEKNSGCKYEYECAEILGRIASRDAMCCTGSCHHQKPAQYHCRQIGKEMNMGHSAVWDRVNHLLQQGYLERVREDSQPVYFVVTPKGREWLHNLNYLA